MSLLREVKPRNARTARIVKAREPQLLEDRKRVLLLHGSKCPEPIRNVLKTITTLTKPHAVQLTKKNENIHPFEDASSLEFLALKNDCALVAFATHSKKRPNNISLLRIFDGKVLDMVELLLLISAEESVEKGRLEVGVEMKPMILFAGSQWDDNSASEQATLFRQLKSTFLDVFQGEEISSIDVAGLQYVLMIAAGETNSTSTTTNTSDPSNKPVIHLRWYKVRTLRSDTPKVPRVELDQIGPSFDFRIGRHKFADESVMKEAMKHGRRPNEARTKKNIETDTMGDKLGRIHLGRQNLDELQTRKMKGLKRGRDEVEGQNVEMNGNGVYEDEDVVTQSEDEEGGVMFEEDEDEEISEGGSSVGGTGDEIDIGEESGAEADAMPKRQRLA
ncbi:rRNA-binding ribosome biosynthesis protein rpf2 [Neophaeococcomyces mojaviensis]|uniref:rRNA-binding ribosome biosynthesis protein rpf2 n=1 Tax=Neophaeococcomyces mojaviensis TaxID=3383035 RepID=A0ACC2ZZ83_9EURO|nr:rRNA-binding ribosome biosynthesis protein rpf2 [Knufia sp. JES_112]